MRGTHLQQVQSVLCASSLLAFTNLDHFWNSDLKITRHHVRLDISLDHRPIQWAIGRILVIIEFELKSTESVHMRRAARHGVAATPPSDTAAVRQRGGGGGSGTTR